MGLLRALFGPSQDEIWSQIAADIGGDYVDGGFWGKDVLIYEHSEWKILLDTYTVTNSTGNTTSSTTYTRMRAPFVNKDGLYFKIYRKGLFSPIGKLLGLQDIEVGDAFFDDAFIIKGNSAHQISRLLADDHLKGLFHRQPDVHLEVKDDEGWFGPSFPDGVDELYFECVGVIKDAQTLKSLFELFAVTLIRLVAIDSAYEHDPDVTLK